MSQLELSFEIINQVLEKCGFYAWEFDQSTETVFWSPGIRGILGLDETRASDSLDTIKEKIVHHRDKEKFEKLLQVGEREGILLKEEIRLRMISGEFEYFEILSLKDRKISGRDTRILAWIINISGRKKLLEDVARLNQLLSKSKQLANLIYWEYDLASDSFQYSDFRSEGLEMNEEIMRDIFIGQRVHVLEGYKELLAVTADRAFIRGIPYDIEIEILDAKRRSNWIRLVAEPVLDNFNTTIGQRGLVQDISIRKYLELELRTSIDILSDHNRRLLNFAHIVTHNLRNHSGNLKTLKMLISVAQDETEKQEYLEKIFQVIDQLHDTIFDLSEVVNINVSLDKKQQDIVFEEILQGTIRILRSEIEEKNLEIEFDFSEATYSKYVKSYMESIFLNFISNAIKYRDPNKVPSIFIKTFRKDKTVVIRFQDNGRGIDLKKWGKDLFGMYMTFHGNKDAKGIGLFITKNQVESLGGHIEVQSEVDKGSTFDVYL
ncbi:hypothetical protein CH373_14150 [Leptospira perolatii]|uniref:histidine kinase n=1 Tax=Leptospira perolatii TaxID=2023191 RepID=A0A2M9ZKE7_9LEPT|nr:PAS domain-containing sensor histidine kinase [Leptospira perolatii]PJZ69411.1 hypothetical protein CH360_11715 [Leptospira perolatii]PJZ72546.1 hypothetical protein CH373_14150 [Leptospira perolatii]